MSYIAAEHGDGDFTDTSAIRAPEPQEFQITFHNAEGDVVVRIWPGKGEVWIDESMTVDDAARRFWDAVRRLGGIWTGTP